MSKKSPRYLWRGLVYSGRHELVHHVGDAHSAEHVTVGQNEMHVTLDNGDTLIFDMTPPNNAGAIEVCDTYKHKYAG